MGLEGFSNNASGGMSPGDHLYAKTFNKLATSADKAQIGPSDGVIFTANNGGVGMYIPQQNFEQTKLLQQFEIVVDPYQVAGEEVGLSIIRVVKGEVVWIPVLPQDEIPLPIPTDKCVTQTTIENWFALPTFPIIDDENSEFIGDGGIRVPNVEGIDVGIYVFKSTMLPVDHPPIIIAVPNTSYSLTCPVAFPGTPPFPLAVWQAIKVGSAKYEVPEGSEEGTPPQWIITQNFIGSMVFPGGGSSPSVEAPKLPPQLPSTAIQKARPMPFECRIEVDSGGDMLLKIGNGTVSYTRSNMPYVGTGSRINRFQMEYDQLQVCPSGWKKQGNAADGWMAIGGGYKITGEGQWYLVASYWDALEGPNFTLPDPVKPGRPFLSLIDAYGADVDKLFVETGPGLYTNTMNIQKMSGYTSEDTGEDWDWGYCHTTYFNPMKLGYDAKMIARIESLPADQSVAQIFVSQTATESRNQIQNIYFPVLPKDGFVVFTYDGFPSLPFYPAPWSGVNNATDLFNALQAIPALVGNIQVTRTSDNNFYVTFINELEKTDCPLLVANNSGLESWPYEYVIDQYHVGNLVLDTTPRFDGTQIMNKADMTSAEDPYVIQSNNNPAFDKVINRDDLMACTGLSGDNDFTTAIIPIVNNSVPRGVTERQFQYGVASGCSGETCDHPFQVHLDSTVESETFYSVCAGTVNNIVPENINSTFVLADQDTLWLRCEVETTSKDYPFKITIQSGSSFPADTDQYGYIKVAKLNGTTIEQYITGSLWTDRIKLGSNTATYYFARV